jgi:ketosteroid isomerase-like protein
MTIVHDTNVSGADQPEQLLSTFVAAFDAADSRAIERIYEDGAVLAPRPGQPVTGPGLLAAHEHLLRLGLPMRAQLRHTYVAGDIALLIVDWSIEGNPIEGSADGRDVHFAGTATDVARRGADGCWRYVIDNPFGTS